jgi:hypothetical protein
VLLGAFLDPLVDAAEDLLVAGSPIGKLHRRILAQLRLAGGSHSAARPIASSSSPVQIVVSSRLPFTA